MRNGHVFEGDVEFVGAFEEVSPDAGGYGFTLCDQFSGVELCDYGFEDFIADGGEDALVVVETEGLGGKGWLVMLAFWGWEGAGWSRAK